MYHTKCIITTPYCGGKPTMKTITILQAEYDVLLEKIKDLTVQKQLNTQELAHALTLELQQNVADNAGNIDYDSYEQKIIELLTHK